MTAQKIKRALSARSNFLLFLLLILFIIFYIPNTYATNDTINLTEFPELVGDAFTVNESVAGLILSAMVLLSIGLALAFLKAKGLILIAVEFVAMAGLIYLGWMPYFVMLVIVLILALSYAGKIRRSL